MEWRSIPGWPEYETSDEAKIRRVAPYSSTYVGRILRPHQRKDGYWTVVLCHGGRVKLCYLHRLVCAAFNGPPSDGSLVAAHLDGSQSNNQPNNIAWVTAKENESHKVIHGTYRAGEQAARAILTWGQVTEIRKQYEGGATQCTLAAAFNTSQSNVSRIVKGQIWRLP